jgi:hypothetical protein
MFTAKPMKVDVWGAGQFHHREIDYSPKQMRMLRRNLFVVSDFPPSIDESIKMECDGIVSTIDDFNDDMVRNSVFYVYFSRAEMALPSLRRIVACGGLFAPPPHFSKVPFHLVSTHAYNSFNHAGILLGHEPFTGLEVASQLCQAAELTRSIPGDFVEVGVFSGSSALVSLLHMRSIGVQRRCYLLDTYTGFTYESAKSSSDMIWGGTHLQEKGPSIDRIEALMAHTGQETHVVPNNICTDPLPSEIKSIALANIDVDLYDAIASALNKVGELMAVRGIMVVEDPTGVPGLYGAYLAMSDFLETELGKKFVAVRTTTQYFLVRVSP